jgi:hypothetical protein
VTYGKVPVPLCEMLLNHVSDGNSQGKTGSQQAQSNPLFGRNSVICGAAEEVPWLCLRFESQRNSHMSALSPALVPNIQVLGAGADAESPRFRLTTRQLSVVSGVVRRC